MIGKGQPNGARSALKPPECSARGQPAAASARGLPIGKGWGGSLTPSPSFELGRDAGVRPHCARRPSDRGLRRERLATAKPARVAQAPAAAKRAAAPKSKGATAMAACASAPWTAAATAETFWWRWFSSRRSSCFRLVSSLSAWSSMSASSSSMAFTAAWTDALVCFSTRSALCSAEFSRALSLTCVPLAAPSARSPMRVSECMSRWTMSSPLRRVSCATFLTWRSSARAPLRTSASCSSLTLSSSSLASSSLASARWA
mmetsp:Transcript_34425/g.91193  ORF Transcript_34425/g.91193 Transcript_34425/m.91193 type:complete len:259 (+) Transcript_34425:308-1084(+)